MSCCTSTKGDGRCKQTIGREIIEIDSRNFSRMIQVVYKGPNSQALRKFVEFLYEQEDELLTDEDRAAIQEGREMTQGLVCLPGGI